VCCAVEAVCLRKDGTRLVPRRRQQGIATVPVQESERVVGRTAVGARVAEPQVITVDKRLQVLVSRAMLCEQQYVREVPR
jgi:hypothetical protein